VWPRWASVVIQLTAAPPRQLRPALHHADPILISSTPPQQERRWGLANRAHFRGDFPQKHASVCEQQPAGAAPPHAEGPNRSGVKRTAAGARADLVSRTASAQRRWKKCGQVREAPAPTKTPDGAACMLSKQTAHSAADNRGGCGRGGQMRRRTCIDVRSPLAQPVDCKPIRPFQPVPYIPRRCSAVCFKMGSSHRTELPADARRLLRLAGTRYIAVSAPGNYFQLPTNQTSGEQ
jgi:hypothetical protein